MTESWLPRPTELDPFVLRFRSAKEWTITVRNQVAVERVRKAVHDACRELRRLWVAGTGVKSGDCGIVLPTNTYLMFLWATQKHPDGVAPADDSVNYGGVVIRPEGDLPWAAS